MKVHGEVCLDADVLSARHSKFLENALTLTQRYALMQTSLGALRTTTRTSGEQDRSE